MEIRDLDCLYETCPIPLIKAIKQLKKMSSGDILVVHSDESCVEVMFREFAEQNGYEIKVMETNAGEWEIDLRKP